MTKEPARKARVISPTKASPNKNKSLRGDGYVSSTSAHTGTTDQSSTQTLWDEPMQLAESNVAEKIITLTEEIEEMNLAELQHLAKEWKSYHKLEKFNVSAFKRLELQLKVEKWRKDTIRQINILKMHKNITKSDNNIQERTYS